ALAGAHQAAGGHHRHPRFPRRAQGADPAAGRDRREGHLPPDQSAARDGTGFRTLVPRGDVMDRLKIGISACFFHPDGERKAAPSKTLLWIEQSTAHWVMSEGALPVMVPSFAGATFRGEVRVGDYADFLDGLVMHGGADVWPGSYGEQPLRPEWHGDRVRDEYEIALVKAFVAAGKPVFG